MTSIGFIAGAVEYAVAAAHTMQRANSLGPGDRWLDNAIDPWVRTATARLTCSANITSPVCNNISSSIMFLTAGVYRSSSP